MKRWLMTFLLVCSMFATNAFADDAAISFDASTANCFGSNIGNATSGTVKFKARWRRKVIPCVAGQYVPAGSETTLKCPVNSFCPGPLAPNTGFEYSETIAQGIETCPDNLKSPAGSKKLGDCGRILHVGGGIMYMHQERPVDGPVLVIKIGSEKYYANLSNENNVMTLGSDKKLHIKYNSANYTAFDNSVLYYGE